MTTTNNKTNKIVRRLRDEKYAATDASAEAWSGSLLDAAEPELANAETQHMMTRVAARLASKKRARAAWVLRPAVAAVGLLSFAAVASAAIERHAIAAFVQSLTTPRAETIVPTVKAIAPLPAPAPSPVMPTPTPTPAPIVPPVEAPRAPRSPLPPRATPLAARPTPPAPTPSPAAAPPSESDLSLLVAATRALRADHDPQHATVLAETYLRAHPHSALSEEALAVIMESATSNSSSDTSAARAVATRYLAAYPNGRYAKRAHRMLEPAESSPSP